MKRIHILAMLLTGVLVWCIACPARAEDAKGEAPEPEWLWLVEPVELNTDGAPVAVDFVVISRFPGDTTKQVLGRFVSMGTTLHAALLETEETKKHFRPAGIDPSGQRVNFVPRGGLTTGDGLNVAYYRVEREEDEYLAEPSYATPITRLGLVFRPEPSVKEQQEKCTEGLKEAGLVMTPPETGKAFSFSVYPEVGKKLDLEAFRGKVVLIDWWATWCSPCLDKMPWLIDISHRWESEGLVVISANLDETRSQALRTLERFYLPDPLVRRWKSQGLFGGEGSIERKVLAWLRDREDDLSAENERVVLSSLLQLGVMDRMAAEQGNVFERIGVSWTLFHVPKDVRECVQTLAGGSLPRLTIVGPNGVLRYHGYPHRSEIEELIESLVHKE